MRYTLDKSKGEPLYLQLYRVIKDDVVSGVLRPGDKLYSKRTLAAECGVSVITVEHTYSLLADEGYIVPREKSGFYVAEGDGVIPSRPALHRLITHTTGGNVNDFPLSSFKRHMRAVMADYEDELLVRSPNNGRAELREAISDYLKRFRGIDAPPDQIVIGAGSEYLYSLLIQLFGRDKLYAIEDPCYRKIEQVYTANGVKLTKLPLGDDGITPHALRSCGANVLHITPYHSFPSGVTASPSKRAAYVAWARERGSYIIEDDYESEFSTLSKPVDTILSLDPDGRVVYINTFSQTLAPSMRVGYMVIPSPLARTYEERLGFYSCTVPVFDQLVLASFIDSGEFERYINKVRRKLRNEKKGSL